MTNNLVVYLTNFGLVRPNFYLNQDFDKINLFNPKIDENCYLAPEIFDNSAKTEIIDFAQDKEKVQILQKADIFSLGCIIFKIFSGGKDLFNHRNLKDYKKSSNPE